MAPEPAAKNLEPRRGVSKPVVITLGILAVAYISAAILVVSQAAKIDQALAKKFALGLATGLLVALTVGGGLLGLAQVLYRADRSKQIAYYKIVRLVWAALMLANILFLLFSCGR
jgi:uncharacterized membrane-anchored protein